MTAGCESRILLSLSLNDVADRMAVLGCSHIAFRRREKITVANSSIQLDSAYSQLLFATDKILQPIWQKFILSLVKWQFLVAVARKSQSLFPVSRCL